MARAKGVSLAFMAVLSCCVLQGVGGVTIEFRNECEFPVWTDGTHINNITLLTTGQSWTVPLTAGSTGGRFWGRTGCVFGQSCPTGDCQGVQNCTPRATMVEYSRNETDNLDYYDISLVGGFNLPISFIPSNPKCQPIACSSNITADCPEELTVPGGCMSACTIFNKSQYCCTGDYMGNNCRPTNYSSFFETQCPHAHSYPLGNATGTFNCSAGSNYTLVFCGGATSSPSVAPSGAGGMTIELLNECQFKVWPVVSQVPDAGVQLGRGESWKVPLPAGWTGGKIWGRTGCLYCTSGKCEGVLYCITGQCESVLNCEGMTPPATLAHFSFQGYSNVPFYDISLIGGFNIPISLIPSNSNCQPIACSSNITANCPAELRVRDACMSACTIFKTSDQYCRPSNYSRFFKTQCPQAYTYPTDDNNTSFTCYAGSNYRVVFCGASIPSPVASFPSPVASVADSSAKTNGHLIGITVGGALITLAMMVVIAVYWKKFKSKQHLNEDYLTIMRPNPTKSRAFKLREIMESTQNFNQNIGQGGFGSVFFGKLEGRDIAVKVLSVFSTEGLHQFQNEVDLLSKIYHKNLVSLLGFCNVSKEIILIYEYMCQGCLRDHLYGGSAELSPLNWKTRLKIALDAAQGLEYLHLGCTPKIVHRNIKSANILLDGNMNGKVADFGLSRISVHGEASYANTTIKGKIGYLDPEYFRTQMLTAKSDVYSFGVVLLEIICGRPPINANLGDEELNLIQWVTPYVKMGENCSDIEAIIDKKLDGNYDMGSIVKVARLALRCVEGTPSCRPSMYEVVAEIKEAITCENENNGPSPLILEGTGIEHRDLVASKVQQRGNSRSREMELADNSSNLPQEGR